MSIASGIGQQPRTSLFPILLKRATLQATTEKEKAIVFEDEEWQLNPVLQTSSLVWRHNIYLLHEKT
jgi:hypothetical protein